MRPRAGREVSARGESPKHSAMSSREDGGKPQAAGDAARRGEALAGEALWAAAVERVANHPAWSWTAQLQFVEESAEVMTLRLRQGRGRLMAFLAGQQDNLNRLISQVAGRPMRAEVQPPPGGADEAGGSADRPRPVTQADKDQAMRLPLVRRLADVFDADLIDVRDDPDRPPPDRADE